jgi:hypothetical protein
MDLHAEIETYVFSSWVGYAIVHALIDAGRVLKIECQMPECRRDTRVFAKSGRRGQGDLLVIDHIVHTQDGGSNRIENLRLAHLSCNSGWRKGRPGVIFTDEAKARISAGVRKAHADGKFKKIYTPERGAKISAAFTGRPLADETKSKIRDARTGQPSGFKGRKHTPEAIEKIRQARQRRKRDQ